MKRTGSNGEARPLRIGQVAPLIESVPPHGYGGTERVVSYLTEELINLGHEVTLFASGDSETRAELVSSVNVSLRASGCVDPLAPTLVMLEQVKRYAPGLDILHFHIDYLHFPVSRQANVPHVTTLHGRLDQPHLLPLYREFDDMPLVSISHSQRKPLPFAHWRSTVPHGLPLDLYRQADGSGGYLAFLGRISPEKRVDRAIEIAGRAGLPLKIAAKIDRADQAYYQREIAPLMKQPHVELIGELPESGKQEFLGNARALLFPIDWPEPFGLVMIEALACGTPVIAFRRGSVPEVIEPGRTGFVCDDVDEAVAAVARLDQLSRRECRASFERRFTATRMATDYVDLYRRQLEIPHVRREPASARVRDPRDRAARG